VRITDFGLARRSVWETASGNELFTLKGHTSGVYTVAFGEYGRTLATASGDKTTKLWDLESGQKLTTLQAKKEDSPVFDFMTTVMFAPPNSRRIAVAGYDKTVRIWDAATFDPLLTFRGHGDRVYSLCYSADGARIASAAGKLIKIWNAETGAEAMTLKGHSGLVYDVCFSPNGRRLASTGGGALKIWDTASGLEVLSLPCRGQDSVRFSPDTRSIATIGVRGRLQLWESAASRPSN